MRLHRLTVTAFGPYPGSSVIDFDLLSGAGIFLLHGATGAGKTSVLDAVCYALYGGVPGARQGMRLRSDHAEPPTATEVVLELTVAGRRLELTRRPEQPRPKRRGSGTTTEKAVSLLREQLPGGEWKALSRSHSEIGEEITQLLGMSREQFCQVVLLPQGDFARFLRSDAGDRADLLGKLFDTGRFAAVEQWLAERRRESETRVRAQDETLTALAHRAAQAAGPLARSHPLPGLVVGEPDLAARVLEWAALVRTEAREHRDITALALGTAEAAHRTAGRCLEAAAERHRLQERHAVAVERAAALDRTRPEADRDRDRLARAEAADRVAPALDAQAIATDDRARADRRRRETAAALPPEFAGAGSRTLAAAERDARRDLGRLDAARRAETRIAAITADHARLDREAAADEESERETQGWLADWEHARDACRARLDAAQEAATAAADLAGRLDQLRRRTEAARRRDALTAEERDTSGRLSAAAGRAADAREHWLDRKERRLRGIAAELAAGLLPDAPCPVCGNADHPRPARPGPEHVDRAAEDAAHDAYRAAEADRAAAEAALRALRDRLADASAEAAEGPADELADRLADLSARADTARRTAADAHPAREELRHAEREFARRQETQHATRQRQAARGSQRESLDAELAALREQLDAVQEPAGAAAPGGVAERAARLTRSAALLADAAEAARALEAADVRLTQADLRLAGAAREAGFADPAEAARALVPADERHPLRQRVETHLARQAWVEAELADPQVAAAAAAAPADPGTHRERLAAATAALRTASAAAAAAAERCAELDRLSREAVRRTRELAPLREEHATHRRLAQLTAGTAAENELRMRLESYVLAARLEQVAAAASARLRRMTGGRYTLVHTDARGGRGRSGLGLRVVDAWTGSERDTATLSGGETFSASLALALGLADVVTDEAGAVRLDTLFIDEGFGSLDEQTLDEVLDVLDSLRERDRTVGIVSHVADLRHRIPAQLEVVKGRDGSRVRHRTLPGRRSPRRGAALG